VRRVHADRLEDMYEKGGKDHYLFAVDQSEYIVDATNKGGMARFVNHSCGCAPLAPWCTRYHAF
jgi:SET domain-containing protein